MNAWIDRLLMTTLQEVLADVQEVLDANPALAGAPVDIGAAESFIRECERGILAAE